jgi:hypothetical protein
MTRIFLHLAIYVCFTAGLSLSGCAASPTVFKAAGFDKPRQLKYMIFPFGDANSSGDKRAYPEAAITVRDQFETALLQQGFTVEACPDVLIRGDKHPDNDLTVNEGYAIELGKQKGVDAVVFGTLTAFSRGTYGGGYTTVGFNAVAVDVKTTKILWKVSHYRPTLFYYEYEPAAFSQEVVQQVAESLR